MRGLIEAGKINDVKHVIFMDDDGSCEIESICRTHAFLLMAKDKNTVVTGCMLLKITRQSYMNLVPYGIEIFYITRINIIWMLGK